MQGCPPSHHLEIEMKVRDRYTGYVTDYNTEVLINEFCGDSNGQIERLESQVIQLQVVLAALIDYLKLPDQTILEITRANYRYEVEE